MIGNKKKLVPPSRDLNVANYLGLISFLSSLAWGGGRRIDRVRHRGANFYEF